MKKIIILFLLSFTILSAQENKKITPFSEINYGVFGGLNFNNTSQTAGSFIFELGTGLTHSINLNLSAGYLKIFEADPYPVKTFTIAKIQDETFYYAEDYEITKFGYDILPLSVGLRYNFIQDKSFSPYLLIKGNYNIIEGKTYRTSGFSKPYNSLEEIPEEYKNNIDKTFPSGSFGITFGIGNAFTLSSKIGLDLRYLYKYDNEIINSHHFVVGITF